MNKHNIAVALSLSGILLFTLGAGCGSTVSDGGIYKSGDRAQTWEQKVFAGQQGKKISTISNLNTTVLVQDPTNNQNLFLGTDQNGLWYSGNFGEEWGQVSQISTGKIRGVIFDPVTASTIYVLKDNQILKTTDAGANWVTAYTETTGKVVINLGINPQAPTTLIAGLENGKVIRSVDGGSNWSVVLSESRQPISRIIVNPSNPSIVFALEYQKNLWRSQDGGLTWEKLYDSDHILEVGGVGKLDRLSMDPQTPATLYIIADGVGLIRSDDSGDNWSVVSTLVGKEAATITGFQVDPSDSNTLWMAVGHFIHVSYDRGATWNVNASFPSSRQINCFLIDRLDPNTIFVGTMAVPKKGGLFGPG